MKPDEFLSKDDQLKVTEAIKAAELKTSGEIRVHLDSRIKGDVLDRAAYIFKFLRMNKTRERNGVLFYVAIENRKFAILGDAGINAIVPADFWDKIKERMSEYFAAGSFADGLAEGIKMAGEQLQTHFPWQPNDLDELPDEISSGN